MRSLRNVLLLGGWLVLSACATQTFNPDQAPEYTITRNFTPFYNERPTEGATTDISLKEKTRLKLLRKGTDYSLVQLEDSRTGYVANKNMVIAPPGSEKRPFGSTSEGLQTPPRRKKRISRPAVPTPSPSPVLQPEQSSPQQQTVPSPTPAPTPEPPAAEAPPPTPAPTPQPTPLEKPKFRL